MPGLIANYVFQITYAHYMLSFKRFTICLWDIANAGYCLEPMDGEKGLEAKVTPGGTLTIDEDTSYLTITKMPIGQSSSDIPSVERRFREPVSLRAVVMTLRSPKSTSAPSQPETGTQQPAAQEKLVEVTLTLQTKKPGEDDFTPLIDDSTGEPKVRTGTTDSLHLVLYLNFQAKLFSTSGLTLFMLMTDSLPSFAVNNHPS